MKSVQSYVEKHIKRPHPKIRQVCEPLLQCFGINYFTYHSVTPEGYWRPIVSRMDWADYYTQNQVYLIDPFLMHPNNYQSGALLWTQHLDKSYKEILETAEKQFQMSHGFIIIDRHAQGCDFFGFAAPKQNEAIYSIYLKYQPHLKKFCNYFKSELAQLIKSTYSDPIDLRLLKGKDFDDADLFPRLFQDSAGMSFLHSIKSKPSVNLTKREKQTLSLYIDDMYMQEVADKLGLSVRTIECYLGKVKDKLDCKSKSDLIKKGRELRLLGLIK